MATVSRRPGSSRWIVRWYDEAGVRREKSARTADKSVALGIARDIERQVAMRRAGLIDPRAERRASEDRRELSHHLGEFATYLEAKGSVERHVSDMMRRIRAVVALAKLSRISDIAPARIQAALAERKAEYSDRGANKDLTAIRSFVRWLIRDGRLVEDPIAGIQRYRVTSAPMRRRRALTQDEILALLATAEAGSSVCGMSGPDRAMLYRIALGTGFRSSELGSLRRESFHLDDKSPAIVVEAGHSKHRREDVQVIRRDLAEILRPWLASKAPGRPVFAVKRIAEKTAKMIRADLRAAGVEVENDAGLVDFHALRHTFISLIVAAGASPKVAQTLARHADPSLTFKVYSHAHLSDVSRALESLPTPDLSVPAALAATGTGAGLPPFSHPSRGLTGPLVSSSDTSSAGVSAETKPRESENAMRKEAAIAERSATTKWWARPDSNREHTDYESVKGGRKSRPAKGSGRSSRNSTQNHTHSLIDIAAALRETPEANRDAAIAAALKAIRAVRGAR